MKKILLMMIALVFLLTACEKDDNSEDIYNASFSITEHIAKNGIEGLQTLTCESGFLDWTYIYNNEYLVEYYFMGELIEDGSVVEGIVMDYESFVTLAGGIQNYIDNTIISMEDYFNATCLINE